MSFLIPKKSFLSFSRKQLMDTFLRMAEQIVQGWMKEDYRINELKQLEGYLKFIISNHPDQKIIELTKRLIPFKETTEEEFSEFILKIERIQNKDVAEENFLVSTKDQESKTNRNAFPIHLVLDNLRSSFNIGSLFRTAESFNIQCIHLCGYSPTPENSKTAKSALGTQEWIEWKQWESVFDCLETLKLEKIKSFAFETSPKAIELNQIDQNFIRKNAIDGLAIVLGNERYGLASALLSKTDHLVNIRMDGRKNSLNVGVCGAIALHHFRSLFNFVDSSFDKEISHTS